MCCILSPGLRYLLVAEGPFSFCIVLEEERLRKIEALAISNAGRALQISQFLERFDAFGDHRHPKRVADRLDGFQDALAAWTLVNICDERAIDFDLVGSD